ncbi:uncharacterized protein BT62DRAFT_937186 [Guyanagaster necrorhizus]|uniref:Uncharacterized protein n=1 Tax=Guyanagaster necrorhizus TaxID=856835 RepID=A0A9P7VI07_9AGAR|nr:uncharacterized protein BT62DRAFT_937186 [Guyanagaster necrorhizus MCA 3950]KAG7441418.1 hypothetical protein BT62DRAFT_937186 [Guyanagaster necrorhizus MCA 3950]
MVATASAAAVSLANEEKKRKQTMERAKATHLSRQLQMRLQYAKLKVEHGWTKQTLNEVENLYFHHSHTRGPRPTAPTNQLLSESTLVLSDTPSPRQSSLSFKSNISRASTLIDLDVPTDIEVETTPDPTVHVSANSSFTPPPPAVAPLQPSPFLPDSALSRPRTQSPSLSPVPTGKTQTKPWPSPTLTPKRQPAKLLSAPDIYGKGQQPGPVLTYDSFWSKHTLSAPHYRSLGSLPSRGSVSDVTNDVG